MSAMEQWAAIPSAPGYEASDLGRVRSVDRDPIENLEKASWYLRREIARRTRAQGRAS